MKTSILKPGSAEGYQLCQPLDEADFESFNLQIDGTTRATTWQPVKVAVIESDEGAELRPSDSPWLGSNALIFSTRAREALGSFLDQHGELLPLDCSGRELSVFNPTRIIDALDHEATDAWRFDDGRIMRITRHMFREDVVRGVHMFKIPDMRVSPTFVSQDFVDAWSAANLVGLDFTEVWSAP